jgi:hypothetical protein
MPITILNVSSPVGETLFFDSTIGGAVDAVKQSSAVIFYVTCDNKDNITPVFVKLFDLPSSQVVVGTTPPDLVFKILPGVINTYLLSTNAAYGFTFSNAVSACCTTQGGTQGTQSPANFVRITIAFV